MSGLRTTFVTGFAIATGVFLNCTRAELSSAAEPKMTIGCQIRVTSQNEMLRLDAVANGPESATGNYRFEILKQSPSGTSQNVQSGAFGLDADRDAILTTVVLDGSARGHYRARLTLDTKEFGSVSCVSP
ncbi:curli-like amyloid fiber formation chaperone CsgH [Bradyrhizobium valentinum]|nr:curli-like amyloid fiber formation chaperone CsgH [Bradyrhizobium valentinum]